MAGPGHGRGSGRLAAEGEGILTGADFIEFAALLAQVAEVYGKPRPTSGVLKVFAAALNGYGLKEISRALSVHVRTSKFMPRPADLIELLEGTAEARAQTAWQKVMAAQRRCSGYCSVAFDDPLIHYSIERLGGWTELSEMMKKDKPFRERDFIAWYVKGERAGIGWKDVPSHLAGLHELSNRQCGKDPALLGLSETYTGAIIRIGDKDAHRPIEAAQEGDGVHHLVSGVGRGSSP